MKGLLFITHQTDKYTYLESAKIALEGGCRQIQLRMKDIPVEQVEKIAFTIKEICDVFQAQFYIDDHVEVCKKVKAAGVHLGKSDMSPVEARRILGDNYIIGGTANTFEDIVQLYKAGVNYIGLGPFRFTATKKNLSPVLGLAGYSSIIAECRRDNIQLPVVAIGGITKEDIPAILQTGVSGIALSSTILQAQNPVEETKRILKIIQEENERIDHCR